MNLKRALPLGLTSFLLLTSVLSGCSSSNEGETQASDNPSQSNGKPFAGKKLSLLYMTSVYADAARAMIPEFEEKTGAKVEIADVPFASLHEKELLDLTSNTGVYDVIDVASQWDGEFAPFVNPLKPNIDKDKFDISDFKDNVLNNSGRWQGELIGIPNAVTPMVMTYRTDLVSKAPETWEEYYEIAKKFTKPAEGMYGISIPAVKSQVAGLYYIRLWSRGADLFDVNWKASLDNQPARKALEDLKESLKYADPAALSWGLPESINAFLNGNAVFCEAWPTLGILQDADNPAKSKIVGKWALAPMPKQDTGATYLSAWDLQIPKGSKNKELAWEWIKMYTNKEKQYEFYKNLQILSPRNSFWDRDDIKSSKNSTLGPALDKAMFLRIPQGDQISSVVKDGISSYMSGQFTLDKATNFMDDSLNSIMSSQPMDKGVKNQIADTLKSLKR